MLVYLLKLYFIPNVTFLKFDQMILKWIWNKKVIIVLKGGISFNKILKHIKLKELELIDRFF